MTYDEVTTKEYKISKTRLESKVFSLPRLYPSSPVEVSKSLTFNGFKKDFGSEKNYGAKKNFGRENFFCLKSFGSKKIVGPKFFLAQINFGSE